MLLRLRLRRFDDDALADVPVMLARVDLVQQELRRLQHRQVLPQNDVVEYRVRERSVRFHVPHGVVQRAGIAVRARQGHVLIRQREHLTEHPLDTVSGAVLVRALVQRVPCVKELVNVPRLRLLECESHPSHPPALAAPLSGRGGTVPSGVRRGAGGGGRLVAARYLHHAGEEH